MSGSWSSLLSLLPLFNSRMVVQIERDFAPFRSLNSVEVLNGVNNPFARFEPIHPRVRKIKGFPKCSIWLLRSFSSQPSFTFVYLTLEHLERILFLSFLFLHWIKEELLLNWC